MLCDRRLFVAPFIWSSLRCGCHVASRHVISRLTHLRFLTRNDYEQTAFLCVRGEVTNVTLCNVVIS